MLPTAGHTSPGPVSPQRIALASLLLWAVATAQAQTNTTSVPVPARCHQLMTQEPNKNTLPQWQAAILQCQHHVPWLAQLGHYLNQVGQYQEAADHLERALLLGGQQIDLQIDYAIAMAGMGDKNSAISLLQDLLQNPQLPTALLTVLKQQQAQLSQEKRQRQAQVRWQTQLQLGIMAGRDSNLMGAPNIDSLSLTFGSTTQSLPLESSYLAQAGNYHRTEAVFHARRQEANGPQWDLLASTRQRASNTLAQAQSSQYELIAERSTTHQHTTDPDPLPGNYLRLSVAELQTRQSGLYQVQGLAAGWGQHLPKVTSQTRCEWRAGAEIQNREHAENKSLNGQYRGLSLHGTCQTPLHKAQRQFSSQQQTHWHISVRTGKDHPKDPIRAGGAQAQTAIQLQLLAPAHLLMTGAKGQWRLSGDWAQSQDALSYSPLLEDGAVRKIIKRTAKIEYLRDITQPEAVNQWRVHGGLEWTDHQSNISLFGLRSWGPFAGLRYIW